MNDEKFATVINCMDGRVQLPVNEWLRSKFKVDYIDTITEAGPNGILAKKNDPITLESIKKRVGVSVTKHGSKVVAVVGHYDCAGNAVGREEHLTHIRDAIKVIDSWGFGVRITGLWVDEDWKVSEVALPV